MKTTPLVLVLAAASSSTAAGCGQSEPLSNLPEAPETTESTAQPLQTPAPPDAFLEERVVGAGNACGRPGSLVAKIGLDRRSFVLLLQDMQLAYPPNPPRQTKNCMAIMHVHAPPGWQYSISMVNTRGYVNLPPNVEVRQTSSYSFGPARLGSSAEATIVGPTDPAGELFTFTDYAEPSPVVWSPCGSNRPFKIESRVTLDARNAPRDAVALVSNDTIDGAFEKVVGWTWRRCAR